jgi:hypothetical protein
MDSMDEKEGHCRFCNRRQCPSFLELIEEKREAENT